MQLSDLLSDPLVIATTWLLMPPMLIGLVLAALRELRSPRKKDSPELKKAFENADLTRRARVEGRLNPVLFRLM
jgi:hypothetical protein